MPLPRTLTADIATQRRWTVAGAFVAALLLLLFVQTLQESVQRGHALRDRQRAEATGMTVPSAEGQRLAVLTSQPAPQRIASSR